MREYNIFISHAWTHDDEYNRLIQNLNSQPYFRCKDYSVPKTQPFNTITNRELIDELYGQIRPCSIVIVIAGMYVKYREWIKKEIEIAKVLSKLILVVRPYNAQRIPQELQDYNMVSWNVVSIVDGIKKYSL